MHAIAFRQPQDRRAARLREGQRVANKSPTHDGGRGELIQLKCDLRRSQNPTLILPRRKAQSRQKSLNRVILPSSG